MLTHVLNFVAIIFIIDHRISSIPNHSTMKLFLATAAFMIVAAVGAADDNAAEVRVW